MTRIVQIVLTLALGVTVLTQPVFAQSGAATMQDDQVFQSFGGKPGIGKVVDDFLTIWQADPRISARLTDADVERLGALLKEQITQLTGGPAVYSGHDMRSAHDGMGIRNAEFNALAEDLQKAMEQNNVPSRAQNKLLAKLAPMQKDIVTK